MQENDVVLFSHDWDKNSLLRLSSQYQTYLARPKKIPPGLTRLKKQESIELNEDEYINAIERIVAGQIHSPEPKLDTERRQGRSLFINTTHSDVANISLPKSLEINTLRADKGLLQEAK